MTDYLDHLKKVPFFSGLNRHELEQVAQLSTELNISAGTQLITEGSAAREFFVIVEGEAEVTHEGKHVATVGEGAIQGELSLLLNRPRAAAVRAKTDMVILDIDRRSFNALLDEIPMIARKMLPVVAERLAANAAAEEH